ncbi:hypothetical protein K5E40_03810 [Pseudomonas baetica]|uniref:hypothetical protein n=1 Tax=Pseudomonas baetica TaxID=674054 RepID=UPI001C8CBFA1|nr:hypothetical protein [Pseudomonas baetica]MBX9404801.1 hypothetical protein [Pseudomonas baetica]
MKLHRYIWPAMQGAGAVLLFMAAISAVTYLLAPPPTLAQICARTNEKGSSAWVACVDKMIQERKQ